MSTLFLTTYASRRHLFQTKKRLLLILFAIFYVQWINYLFIPSNILWRTLPRIQRRLLRIRDLVDENIDSHFRFESKIQLERIFHSFKFPETFVCTHGSKFPGELVLLVGLYRLHSPNLLSDECWSTFFGLSYQNVSVCFNLFISFLITNWSYLLFDNIQYWKDSIGYLSDKIRMKANQVGGQFFHLHHPYRFNIFGFIDTKIFMTCRPGGGPARPGPGAARRNPLIQRSFYTGYRHGHGIKIQAITLPNGMDFHIFGPVSARHHDKLIMVTSTGEI